MKSLIQKVTSARWFPTASKPVLAGGVAAGIVYCLHVFGVITDPTAIQEAVTPLVGLIVTAVVASPNRATGTVVVTVDEALHDEVKAWIATQVASLEREVFHLHAAAKVPGLPPVSPSAPSLVGIESPASTDAPHIEQ